MRFRGGFFTGTNAHHVTQLNAVALGRCSSWYTRKINIRNFKEKPGGARSYLRSKRKLPSCSSGRTNAGGCAESTSHCAWDIPARASERVSGSAAAAALEISPSHPRVPVIDSSDGRFIRECFRVRRFGRSCTSAQLVRAPCQIFRFAQVRLRTSEKSTIRN